MSGKLKAIGAFIITVLTTVVLTVSLSVSVDFFFGVFSEHKIIAWAFPLAGLMTWVFYRLVGVPFTCGTSQIIGNARAENKVSARVIPGVFLGTCATIIVGGSVGKEAAALQMGGGAAASITRFFDLDKGNGQMLCACALSSALSVLLGAPIAGALFAVEAMEYRSRKALDYIAIILAALAAKAVSWGLSLDRLAAFIVVPEASIEIAGHVISISLVCSILAIGFCVSIALLKSFSAVSQRQVPSLVIVGIMACAFIQLFGGSAYSGTGMTQMGEALAGTVDTPYFLAKTIFTLIIIGMGFKGGEIMPTLCIGATLGSYYGHVVGIDASFMAAIALTAYFSACTNCPIAALALACEAFGVSAIGWFVIAAAIGCIASYRTSLFSNTTFYPNLARSLVRALRSAHDA